METSVATGDIQVKPKTRQDECDNQHVLQLKIWSVQSCGDRVKLKLFDFLL